jgi:acyl dehydratase
MGGLTETIQKGFPMPAEKFPIEAGHIMLFARSVGDANPIYYDADHAASTEVGHQIAPPTFVQAADHYDPEYDRRPRSDEPWYGSGREPIGSGTPPGAETGGLGFHAEQSFEYHRPLRPGETLTASVREGKRWEKQGRRGGRLIFTETISEFRDDAGELVVTASFIGVGTEKQVT